MTVSTPSSPPGSSGPAEPRHRASGGRGSSTTHGPVGGHDAPDDDVATDPSGPFPVPRRSGGRHRAPDAAPASGSYAAVPAPRGAENPRRPAGDGPGAGFRPLPPSGFAAPPPPGGPSFGTSSIGVPLGAVPVQREAAIPRHRPPHTAVHPGSATPTPDAPAHAGPASVADDDAVTAPVRRDDLDRAAAARGTAGPAHDLGAPSLRPLSVQRPEAMASPYRPEEVAPAEPPSRRGAPSRPFLARSTDRPWETPPVDRASARLGLVALVIGAIGVVLGVAPWSGLLPRVLPQSALGAIPVFNLAGALLGVIGLGVGAIAMFRAGEASRGLLMGVLGACAGAAAVVVGLVV
ncbi:hypothetical protein LQ327_06265 [Actinomycetospora endophytica]|uniref:Uncharacterized protein n=1 Tax=Actinomycetospora endophytica TaxID=2291215 RepID=A0ABS8P412_9PSEU|nr:hypothetical protein [Actinomycetospora endophytica]MCD2192992.1 hypothetical protein [Actinomycetospora endophytica]